MLEILYLAQPRSVRLQSRTRVETYGEVERFFRTLKEHIIYGRLYEAVDELRTAVDKFVELYSAEWRIERPGFLSPFDARENYLTRTAA
jgi:transposase InsO family protein